MSRFIFPFSILLLLSLVQLGWGAERVRFGNPARANPLYSLPALAAQEGDLWRQNGLQGEWLPFDAGVALHQALAAGSVDLAMSGATLTIQSIARGIPEIMVMDVKSVEHFFYWVRKDSPVKTFKDLKGARVAVSRIGSLTHAFGRAVGKELGMEKDLKFVAVGGTTINAAAVKSGVVEASVNSNLAMARLKFAGDIREVVAVRDYLPKPWMDLVIASRKELVEKKPDTVSRAVKALLQATGFIMKNPEWTMKKMTEEFKFSPELARMMHPFIIYGSDARMDPRAIENVTNFLVEYGIVPKGKVPPVEQLFTNRFAG